MGSDVFIKLFFRNTSLTKNTFKRARLKVFIMKGNGNSKITFSEESVTTFLSDEVEAFILQDFYYLSWLDRPHKVTSTGEMTIDFSSLGISDSFKSSRYSSAASLMFVNASSKVSPCEIQPGSAGIVTE